MEPVLCPQAAQRNETSTVSQTTCRIGRIIDEAEIHQSQLENRVKIFELGPVIEIGISLRIYNHVTALFAITYRLAIYVQRLDRDLLR